MALTKKAERTKAKLMESARRLISEKGFDNVSVEDITKDSGVAKGTFYHYFACKEDVVSELSNAATQATIARAIAYEGDVLERCCFYFYEIYKDCEWNGVRLVRQWLHGNLDPSASAVANEEVLCGIYKALEEILSAHLGERPGELTKDAPIDILCRVMVSHCIGVVTVWCMLGGSFHLAEESKIYMRFDVENLIKPYLLK